MRYSSVFVSAICAFSLFPLWTAPLQAAELRINFRELAQMASSILADAKIRLHNVPGGVFDFSTGSSITIAGAERPIPVPVHSFSRAGARYAYLMNDINSTSIKVSEVPGAIRLIVTFENDGIEVVGRCISGLCPPNDALPQIEWERPGVAIDLLPVKTGNGLSLKAKKLEISGAFLPHCASSAGVIASGLCHAVLPEVRRSISHLRKDFDDGLVQQVNADAVQIKIADAFSGYLVAGPAGEIHISKVSVDRGTEVVVSFCLAC